MGERRATLVGDGPLEVGHRSRRCLADITAAVVRDGIRYTGRALDINFRARVVVDLDVVHGPVVAIVAEVVVGEANLVVGVLVSRDVQVLQVRVVPGASCRGHLVNLNPGRAVIHLDSADLVDVVVKVLSKGQEEAARSCCSIEDRAGQCRCYRGRAAAGVSVYQHHLGSVESSSGPRRTGGAQLPNLRAGAGIGDRPACRSRVEGLVQEVGLRQRGRGRQQSQHQKGYS
ncbi:MAG: hypothetical protein HPKKFMNG_00522 [Planctomycetes bacterium]|nr:hypothetical protein [Planctomycetota bacterium]